MPTTTLPLCPTCHRPLTDTAPAFCADPEKHGGLTPSTWQDRHRRRMRAIAADPPATIRDATWIDE